MGCLAVRERVVFCLPREPLAIAQNIVAQVYGVSVDEMCAASRAREKAARARQVAMYLCHTVLKLGVNDIARAFGRSHSTASYACRAIEDLREDPDVDRTLIWLEMLLRKAGCTP